ncbi:MAG: hypothetical protein JXR67_05495 [Bacteroidales bacterium]|nr:hypothetical protein [Bacteroidales bacterium]
MKILSVLKSGLIRTFRVRTAVLVTWLSLSLLTILLVYPLRASLTTAFGSSMVTERLADGPDIEVFADLGAAGETLISAFANGLIITFFIAFIINAFLTGGLFGVVKKDSGKFSAREFFRSAAANFFPFLGITFIMTLIIGFGVLILGLVPIGISGMSENPGGSSHTYIRIAGVVLIFLIMPVFILVTDYSRAWRASRNDGSCFAALGYGLGRTFKGFWRSYLLMIVLILLQMLFLFIVFLILPAWSPSTGGGVILMLIVSQLLLFLRLFLKTWRYGSVTAMMESLREVKHEEPQLISQADPVSDNL